ncbi:MAG: hypothetical protein AABY53_10245 [Bdellovibrionota bacterium]
MKNFRLVMLDYAKHQLDKPIAQKTLSDMITTKQKNYERTDPNYVVVDKHDMIGTHALIYETTNLFEPRLISAIRLTYECRARLHKLKIPSHDLIPHFNSNCKNAFQKFEKQNPNYADCNSWFIDPEFSHKNSNLQLADISFTMIFLQLSRMGLKNFIGFTNERYKGHRRLEKIISFEKGNEFTHPVVPDQHMLILMENFNLAHLKFVYESNKYLFDNILEVSPKNEKYKSIAQTIQDELVDKWMGISAA